MTRARTLLLPLCVALLTVSCIPFKGPGGMKRELSRSAGVKLDQRFAVTVGRTGMAIARLVTDGDELPLKGVRKVQVGIYKVDGPRRGVDERQRMPAPRMEGWQNIVRVHEQSEDVFVMVREDEGMIRGMAVVVAEEEEWVLVKVRGKLDNLIEQAMEMALDQADRPDLYDSTVAEYRRQQDETGAEAIAADET